MIAQKQLEYDFKPIPSKLQYVSPTSFVNL
jgi:hypothetical protein